MGAGVILLSEAGELLILKPTYKDHWTIPGGVVDANESPREACRREVLEEIGLDISNLIFVAIDYKPENNERDENLQFMFAGGTLSTEQVNEIVLQEDEISAYQFLDPVEAAKLLGQNLGKRLPHCIEALHKQIGIYLEESAPID